MAIKSESRFDKVLKETSSFNPFVEHLSNHKKILFQLPHSPNEIEEERGLARTISKRVAITGVCEDIVESGLETKLLVANPYGTMSQNTSDKVLARMAYVELIANCIVGQNPKLDEKLQIIPDAPLGEIGSFIRDDVIVGSIKDKPYLFGFAHKDRNRNDFLFHLSMLMEATECSAGFMEGGYLRGGNLMNTKRHLIVGRDLIMQIIEHANGEVGPGEIKDFFEKMFGLKRLGKELVVIDNEGELRPQAVYHLDLSFGLIADNSGKEVVLLSSLRKAKELLITNGFLAGDGVSVDEQEWFQRMSYPSMRQDKVDAKAREPLRRYQNLRVPLLNFIREDKERNRAFQEHITEFAQEYHSRPFDMLRKIGENISLFFAQNNYGLVQGYLDNIGRNLKELGYEVFEVPALLLDSELFMNSILPAGGVPIYSPVNGINYNQDGVRNFITAGYLRVFDEFVAQELKKRGVNPIFSLNGSVYASGQAGFHCIALPLP